MKNIKVAFILEFSDGWIGGINYYKNLLDIIIENSDLNITPVLVVLRILKIILLKYFLV